MKILIVDDKKENLYFLESLLKSFGYEVITSANGKNALEKLHTATYDLAVLDMKMPKMSGLELRKKIHEIQPKTKYIFMTGHGSAEDFYAASSKEGADCYLVKPVNIDTLIKKITEILAQ